MLIASVALALTGVGAFVTSSAAADVSAATVTLGPETTDLVKKPAIVGGAPTAISQVPWQVFVQADDTVNRFVYNCGGSIYDATTIITAGHCVFDPSTAAQFSAADMTVVAGVSNHDPATPSGPDQDPQPKAVASIQVHPGYSYTLVNHGVAPDDIAVLKLSTALTLNATARPIPLVAAGLGPVAGTAAGISGFGRQVAGGTPDGRLYGVTTTIGDPLACGGDANAVVLCVASPVGSACEGDSGGPLTVGASLSGVASFVVTTGPTGECGVGSVNGYANLAAPEIQEFVSGNPTPPQAPRGGRDVTAQGIFRAGDAMSCSAGTWSGSPVLGFAFLDTRTGQVLQAGASPTYAFTAADTGRTVACQASATNAGGTGITRTLPSPPIAPAPAPAVPDAPAAPARRSAARQPSLRLSIAASSARVVAGRTVAYTIRVANRGSAAAHRVVVCDAPARGLSFGRLPRGVRKARGRACWRVGTVEAGTTRMLRLTLRVARTVKAGLLANAVTLQSTDGGRRSAAVNVRVRRGGRR
ncbi:trypsin-like serine protease [Conexibacter sp. CPCC 206217]|uniref:trypsin-like serine protease n=1 Tax=Conexibacter sp. CPCC 206217 TaxID=3064574 RepID=UPI0027188FB5|nr:trypsin-like serine protease [Conexibacter sp. CPCC 206217]MDO8213951.1 trypsin-like serine protease [Conexibacter sp. CPCC 206217]